MPPTDTETAEAQALPNIPGFVLLTDLDGDPQYVRAASITSVSVAHRGHIHVTFGTGESAPTKGTLVEVAAAIARAVTGESV